MRAFRHEGHFAGSSRVNQQPTETSKVLREPGVAHEFDAAQLGQTPAPDQVGFERFALARAARLDASALAAEPGGLGSALLLLRAAVSLLAELRDSASASAWRHVTGTEPSESRPARTSASIEVALQRLPTDARLDAAAVMDSISGAGHIASLDETQQRAVFASLNDLALNLGQPLETLWASAKRRELWRGTLWALAVVLSTVVVWKAFAPNNLALHAAVSVSSLDRAAMRATPRGLVDGDRKSMGIHTRKGQGEWASIDLGALETINEVRVYNRRDCCQARAVPLRIEVSSNGSDYATVGRRDKVFDSWTLTFSQRQARYVRVVNESNNVLHLAEVEVY